MTLTVEKGECLVEVPVDVKPQACPNRLMADRRGVISIAIAGNDDLDAAEIDPVTVRAAGVVPTRSTLEDVATPYFTNPNELSAWDCHALGADGYNDLNLKFDMRELVASMESSLGPVEGSFSSLLEPHFLSRPSGVREV